MIGLCIGSYTTSHAQDSGTTPPIHYRIASIDPRFHVSMEQFIQITQQATDIWQKETGKVYFIYDPQAELAIHLIYSKQQVTTVNRQQDLSNLLQNKQQWQSENNEITLYKQQIEQATSTINQKQIALKNQLEQYQKDVKEFNHGSSHKLTAQDLLRQQKLLQQQSNQLQQEVAAHNQNIQLLNQKIGTLNQQQKHLAQSIDQFNLDQRAVPHLFHKGLFENNQILIFGFNSFDDLRLTLAHEFGHALGLGHTNDPKSLMYPKLQEQDIHNFKLTHADLKLIGFSSSFSEP